MKKNAFAVSCLIDNHFDIKYRPSPVIIVAADAAQAGEIAIKVLTHRHDLHKSKRAVCSVEKTEILPEPLNEMTVLMHDFGSVDIGVPVLGESTLVSLNDGREFKVESVNCKSSQLSVSGYDDSCWSIIPIDWVREDNLPLLLEALRDTVGENARPLLRQALLLKDLFNAGTLHGSPYGLHIPSRVLDLPGIFCDAGATLISNDTGTAALIHRDLTGDYTRALVIPRNEFEDIDRVIEALETFIGA